MSNNELSKEEIKKLISSDFPVILDIGSYDGRDASELAELYGECSVYCFEADPRSQELWIQLNKDNRKLFLQKFAVAKINGEIELNLSDSDTRRHYILQDSWSASSSIKKPKSHLNLFPDVSFKETVKVPAIKLDTWLYTFRALIPIIDFIWCDVNGAEDDVILGGLVTLNHFTKYLYIEFSDKELYEGQVTKEKLLSLLPNFEVVGVYNFKGNFGNILLRNKNADPSV